jgi:hypothetical protein
LDDGEAGLDVIIAAITVLGLFTVVGGRGRRIPR